MHLYAEITGKIPEFEVYSVFDREDYVKGGCNVLSTLGSWLNELTKDELNNGILIDRVCDYLNFVYNNAANYNDDIYNNFQVYFFWALDYTTIEKVKQKLIIKILDDGRKYLKVIDGSNFRNF